MTSTLATANENVRLQQIYSTLIDFFTASLADRTWIGRPRRAMQRWIYRVEEPIPVYSNAVRTRLMLEKLGPTYVKLGQIVSSQAAVLPDEWRVELERLQNEVPPFPYEEVRQQIIRELGDPPERVYAEFDSVPLAAASLGQVHVARLDDGQKVAVKVQRPHLQRQVQADLGIVRLFGRYAERRSTWAREVGISSMLQEFSSTLLEELDYYAEAYNMVRLQANLASIDGVKVPELYREQSSGQVLTQEFVTGVKISDVAAMRSAGLDVEAIGAAALRAAIKMLLIDGFFHADPHPGNLIVNTETGEVTFLDCGMVGELTISQRVHLVWLLWAFTRQDIVAMGDQLRALSVPFREVDEAAFRKSWERRMSRYSGTGGGTDVSVVLSQGVGILRDNGLRLDPQLTLALKAMTQASAFYKPLAPPDRPFSVAAIEAAQELGLEAFTEDAVRGAIKKEASRLAGQALAEAPEYLRGLVSWRDQLKRGKFTLYLDTSSLESQVTGLRSIVNQLVVALLVGFALVGTAFASAAFSAQDGYDTFARWATFAFFASLAVGAVLVITFLGSLLRERRKRDDWR